MRNIIHPIPVYIESIDHSIDFYTLILGIPTGGVSEPPAFGIFMPSSLIFTCAGSVGIQPISFAVFLLRHRTILLEIIPLSGDHLPTYSKISLIRQKVIPLLSGFLPPGLHNSGCIEEIPPAVNLIPTGNRLAFFIIVILLLTGIFLPSS